MAELRQQLVALRPKELHMRAAGLGVDEAAIDDAHDADDVKAALIALILPD